MSKNKKNEDRNKNLVYIIDQNGNELPPTSRRGRVRKLLDSGQAVVVKKQPFTIKLLYDCYDDFQIDEKQLPKQIDDSSVGVDKNTKKGDIDMNKSIYNKQLNTEKELETKEFNTNVMRAPKRAQQPLRYPEVSLKELLDRVKGHDNHCKTMAFGAPIHSQNRIELCLKSLPELKTEKAREVCNILVQELLPIFERDDVALKALLIQYAESFEDEVSEKNNALQLATYNLMSAIKLSFANSKQPFDTFVKILNEIRFYSDVNAQNEHLYVPIVKEVLNMQKFDSNSSLFEILEPTPDMFGTINYPECTRSDVWNHRCESLYKYGKVDSGWKILFQRTMSWIIYSSQVNDGFRKSLDAAYYFLISTIQYNRLAGVKHNLATLANYLWDEKESMDYWKLMVAVKMQKLQTHNCVESYQKYLEICKCERLFELEGSVKEQIKECILNEYDIQEDAFIVEKCIEEITLYRIAKDIPLDQDFDITQGLPGEVLKHIPLKSRPGLKSIKSKEKGDEFFF